MPPRPGTVSADVFPRMVPATLLAKDTQTDHPGLGGCDAQRRVARDRRATLIRQIDTRRRRSRLGHRLRPHQVSSHHLCHARRLLAAPRSYSRSLRGHRHSARGGLPRPLHMRSGPGRQLQQIAWPNGNGQRGAHQHAHFLGRRPPGQIPDIARRRQLRCIVRRALDGRRYPRDQGDTARLTGRAPRLRQAGRPHHRRAGRRLGPGQQDNQKDRHSRAGIGWPREESTRRLPGHLHPARRSDEPVCGPNDPPEVSRPPAEADGCDADGHGALE